MQFFQNSLRKGESGLNGAFDGGGLKTLASKGKRLPVAAHKNYGIVGSRAYMDDLTRHFIEGVIFFFVIPAKEPFKRKNFYILKLLLKGTFA